MNPLFPCDHGAATHSCIMHELGRGTVCKKANGFGQIKLIVCVSCPLINIHKTMRAPIAQVCLNIEYLY